MLCMRRGARSLMCWMSEASRPIERSLEAPLLPTSFRYWYRESPPSRNSARINNMDEEFLPLPYYPYEKRPSHMRLEEDEVATALYLSEGELAMAAQHLRVDQLRIIRAINRSPRLQKLHGELASLLNDKVMREYMRAFASDDDRRREWAASKVAQTKQFQSHPLAPNTNTPTPIAIGGGPARIIISWEEPLTIEHDE
jgi:hypothetical protein